MKYGESTFDILYLLFAILSGLWLLHRARNSNEKRMGFAVLILGCGDAFHLIPRVLNYFVEVDFTAALGVGKLITSLTMTAFYVLLYHIGLRYYGLRGEPRTSHAVWALAALRFIVCLLPQNGWLRNESGVLWGVLRNLPFAALGAMVAALYRTQRGRTRRFRWMWLYIVLSFLFYLPVAVGAGLLPILGMLMLPKTVCYVLLIAAFIGAVGKDEAR